MLAISPQQMAAFEALAQDNERRAFVAWLARQAAIVGQVPPDRAVAALDLARPEAQRAGLDTQERLFVYAAARGLMPDITGPQYLLALDLVFSPLPVEDQQRGIVALIGRPNG